MTILCDMLAAWKLEVLSSVDFTLRRRSVDKTRGHSTSGQDVEQNHGRSRGRSRGDSSFYKARWEALTNARKPMQRFAASSAEDKVSKQSLETDGSDENMIRLTGSCGVFVSLPHSCRWCWFWTARASRVGQRCDRVE